MSRSRYILLITVFLVYSKSLLAVKDSSDLVVDFERITQIEHMSHLLYQKLHPTHCTIPGNAEEVSFENNQMPLQEEDLINHSRVLESEIPLQFNEEVKTLINYFGTSWQSKLKEMLVVSNYYFPIYEEIFDRYNMPLEIKYLSVIESALNPYAVSGSGAAGLWQFMHATGKIFDLKVNNYVDERRNIEKSTEAACQYLQRMYKTYGDWFLVIASYNCGPGNVNKAIARSGGKKTFWEIKPWLPKETQRYVPAFIAMSYVMNFHDKYGITPIVSEVTQQRLVKVECNTKYSYKVICSTLELDENQLKSYNPELKKSLIPNTNDYFHLKLPYEKAMLFYQHEDLIEQNSQNETEYRQPVVETSVNLKSSKTRTYKVKRGDSVALIAQKYNVKTWQIRSWNGLKSNYIYPGQKIVIRK
ncbi:MAG: transglycosylase SLT domain-containing protein [Flavobacteriales bacterium]|nr:transglycosylase SLT domain-containing protein [Flavobacteriales bacterium]